MSDDKEVNRRKFLTRTLAFFLGGASAAIGIIAAIKGRKVDPFLSMDASSIITRYGSGRDLIGDINLSVSKQMKYAKRIAKLREDFDKLNPNGVPFSTVLRKVAEEDYLNNRVVLAKNWIISEIEAAVFVYNKMQKQGLIE